MIAGKTLTPCALYVLPILNKLAVVREAESRNRVGIYVTINHWDLSYLIGDEVG